ncbi:glycosyltransferase family 1 protein [Mycetocola sp. 2940]|uniref:glycosyltransferase family 4 protein n=1 Tax=Mycetocola sp. 2940 TaxID=3156452 RepID=UPI00339A13B4
MDNNATGDPLKVTLSMLTLAPGGMGGGETFARELTARLATSSVVDAEVLLPESARGAMGGTNEVIVNGLHYGSSTLARILGLLAARIRTRQVRRLTRAAEVLHFPFTVPTVKAARGQAMVMTIADIQHRDLPDLFSRLEKIFRYFTYERPARKADRIITISNFSKDSIVRHLGVSPDRISVALLGVDTTMFTPNVGAREEFVFYPARGWPHKNHRALIEAVGILRRTRPAMRLVLTGGGLGDLGEVPDWVDNRSLVPLEELRELYRTAAVLGFPSLYEGFGLPPLEAMASGCPVAAANTGSLPEVCGEAAVLFDPHRPESIAAGLEEALVRASELVPLGIEQARTFTWERCAAEHVAAYQAAARDKGSRRAQASSPRT